MNGRQWRSAHGSNCVSATHAATRRYAYDKIQYVSVRTYPSTIQYVRYVSSSLHGSPPPGRRAPTRPSSQITFGRLVITGMEIRPKLSNNNDHDGVSDGVEHSQESDRIPPLKSNRQALEQEHRLSCVFRDCSDASTNFLDQLYGRLVPVSTATGKKM